MTWQDTTTCLRIKCFEYYFNHTLYRRCCSHINSSLPGKCSPLSQDRLQCPGVEDDFRREKKKTQNTPLRFVRYILIARRFQLCIPSLVDSRRIVPYPRYMLSAVDHFYIFLEINSISHHGGIRTPEPTLFEGYYHLATGAIQHTQGKPPIFNGWHLSVLSVITPISQSECRNVCTYHELVQMVVSCAQVSKSPPAWYRMYNIWVIYDYYNRAEYPILA